MLSLYSICPLMLFSSCHSCCLPYNLSSSVLSRAASSMVHQRINDQSSPCFGGCFRALCTCGRPGQVTWDCLKKSIMDIRCISSFNLSLMLYSELCFSDAPRGRMNLHSFCNLWAESLPTLLLFISLIWCPQHALFGWHRYFSVIFALTVSNL